AVPVQREEASVGRGDRGGRGGDGLGRGELASPGHRRLKDDVVPFLVGDQDLGGAPRDVDVEPDVIAVFPRRWLERSVAHAVQTQDVAKWVAHKQVETLVPQPDDPFHAHAGGVGAGRDAALLRPPAALAREGNHLRAFAVEYGYPPARAVCRLA